MRGLLRRLRTASIPLLLFTLASPTYAQVRQLGLQEIVSSASSSFIGTVTNVRYGLDERKDIVTYTTFRVEETVTGYAPGTVTIKQLGGVVKGLDTRIQHIRYFNSGERVLVSIYPNSTLGFSNPIGLNQGVWRVTPKGSILDVTSTQLHGLESVLPKFGISSAAAKSPQPVSLSKKSFTSLMRSLAASTNKGGAAQ